MLYDCFTFYNELDLLTYRLNLLNDVVDYFILVEANHTHVGKEKGLFFNEHKHLFEKFTKKIIHIVVDLPHKHPVSEDNGVWKNEIFQRNAISQGLVGLAPSDLIIISDLDEIPDPRTLTALKQQTVDIYALQMDLYYYNLNTLYTNKWTSSKILSYQKYKDLNFTCNDIRFTLCTSISNGGWHLSYFGDKHFIQNKIQNFAHQEFNNSDHTRLEKIEEMVNKSEDLYGRPISFLKVKIQDNPYLPIDYDKYLNKYFNTV